MPEGDTVHAGRAGMNGDERTTPAARHCRPRAGSARTAAGDAAHPAVRGEVLPNCTSARRSAGFCISTSARKPLPSAPCRLCEPRRCHRRHLPRARPCAGARDSDAIASWRKCSARQNGMQSWARRLHALLRCRPRASMAAMPLSAAACRWRSGWRWPTSCSSATAVTACFFGEGAMAEGRIPRIDEPRRALEAAGAVPLREQSLRHGHRAGASPIPDRHSREGGRLRRACASCRRHGCLRRARPRRARPSNAFAPAKGRTSWSFGPIAFARIRCSTPSSTATRPKSKHGRQRGSDHTFSRAVHARPGC